MGDAPDPLPIIAIGASAGGLGAASRLFDAIGRASDHPPAAAFLLVQHLDPTHPSLLAELLAEHTAMPVVQASDGCPMVAGHVYIIPPGRYLSVAAGLLHLSPPREPHGSRMPFDFLLQSLARACGPQTVGMVLSGTATDGSIGLSALALAGGFVIAQDPEEAEFAGMPRNAIATGQVDRVLRLAEIPAVLAECVGRIARGESARILAPAPAPAAVAVEMAKETKATAFADILSLLKEGASHDFQEYKPGTIERRIERRMGLLAIHPGDLPGYLVRLRHDPGECALLAKDLLINVTSFFRDPQVFETFETIILPEIIEKLSSGQSLRIWVAGCSTGEEAYSLAMICRDAITATGRGIKLQVFASDADADAITLAREGLYPFDIAGTVPPDRLSRYFTREDGGYRILPGLRDDVVFAVQDVLADPPFSRMDLVSCRNLLIYFSPKAQAKVIALFHFALREGGVLMLGASETVGNNTGRFKAIARAERFYHRVARSRVGEPGFSFPFGESSPRLIAPSRDVAQPRQSSLADICARAVLAGHAPAAVLINRQRQLLYSMGPTNRYLQIASGHASHDLLAMATPALRRKLKAAIDQALGGQAPGDRGETAQAERRAVHGGTTRLQVDGLPIGLGISVERLAGDNEDLLLVCFLEEAPPTPAPVGRARHDAPRIADLERELAAAQAELRLSIRNEETASQEHKAIHEEALSVNEEFQSTNEELLTSKEELQSLNEELTALNGQLQETLDRQRLTSDDLQNVLYSTNIGTLFLDPELKIRFFTPAVSALFHIIPGDVGRPLADLRSIAADDALLADAFKVVSGEAAIEREIAAPGDIVYLRRIFPYLTHDGRIEGAVITFADISERKRTEHALEATKQEAESANIAKSRFLAAASHDLRQPLQSLTLLKELLVQAVEGERPKQLLARFDQMLRTISSMLNVLLDINQIEAGVIRPKPVVFPLSDLFERMQDEFGYLARSRDLTLRVVPTSAVIETDPRLLEQIIRNLLGNAIKYTDAGKILLGVRRYGQFLRIEVGDSGIGIAAEELKAVFQEFHQIGNDARESGRGLGLGLSIVQRLGGLLSHAIDVRSIPGKGSLFSVTVSSARTMPTAPVTISRAAPPLLTPERGDPNRHRGKVMVVDDDPEILELLTQLLKADGYIAKPAANAHAALKLVAGGAIHPDLLLTDYNLPGGLNGLELLRRLRAEFDPQLPAIILTGDIATETLASIALADCIQLNKPVDPGALMEAIERLCPSEAIFPAVAGKGALASEDRASSPTAMTYVVDDDPAIRSTICEMLERHGYKVRAFDSAESFFAAYRRGGEGCLLVDAHLPGMSGLGLLRELRGRGDRLPVIFITGDGDVGQAVGAMREGACGFIEKPVGAAELLAGITHAIAESHDIRVTGEIHDGAAALVSALTLRQRQIMDMVLCGDSSKIIAADLGISPRTVENHRAAVMHRMGVKSLPELARLVLQAEPGGVMP